MIIREGTNMQDLGEFEKIIGYEFKDKSLVFEALSHSSFANENKKERRSNERLEFLGDSVLSIVVSDYLFENYTNLPEGALTKTRASLVCEKSLYVFAKEIQLGKYIMLGKGEENMGGRERASILADAFEAVIAAIYLDGGMDAAKKHIMRFVTDERIKNVRLSHDDHKTILQEIIQQNPEEKVEYELVGESGPDHDKHFKVVVKLNSNILGEGEGKSKKQAEQNAAGEALKLMGYAVQ